MVNRLEKIDREGLYSFSMEPSVERESFLVAGANYVANWKARPGTPNQRHMIKMFNECIEVANEFFQKYRYMPSVIHVNSDGSVDEGRTGLVYSHAE